MISIREAQSFINARIVRLASETVAVPGGARRVLAETVRAPRSLPPWNNSAMDGYAVRAVDVPASGTVLPVASVLAAGASPDHRLAPGSAMAIMTGAPLPAGADSVVMRENTTAGDGEVTFSEPAQLGRHVRKCGEDIARGAEALAAGTRLGPGEIAMLASLGFAEVPVARAPRVAILCTGDELCSLGQEPTSAQIISSNEHALAAQVAEAGGTVILSRLVTDSREQIESALIDAVASCDVVVSSGGVSVGDFDFVRESTASAGISVDFWKVAIQPGKPVLFGGTKSGVMFFGLPGNPASSMISFEMFVRPALLALQGAREVERPRFEVSVARAIAKRPGRALYVRAALDRAMPPVAHPLNRQGSGMLSSMVGVDVLVEVAAELGDQEAGARLPALWVGW